MKKNHETFLTYFSMMSDRVIDGQSKLRSKCILFRGIYNEILIQPNQLGSVAKSAKQLRNLYLLFQNLKESRRSTNFISNTAFSSV